MVKLIKGDVVLISATVRHDEMHSAGYIYLDSNGTTFSVAKETITKVVQHHIAEGMEVIVSRHVGCGNAPSAVWKVIGLHNGNAWLSLHEGAGDERYYCCSVSNLMRRDVPDDKESADFQPVSPPSSNDENDVQF